MSARSQHGFHPDAESLSAFAEQALEARERAEVLAHLAVCGRCRQVVALAREAAEADAVTVAAPSRKAIEPNAWWKQWRIVWVPAAIVAAFAAASVSTHIWLADRHERDIVAQNPAPGAAAAHTLSPTEQAEAVPSASPASTLLPAHTAMHTHPTAAEHLTVQRPGLETAETPAEPGARGLGAVDQIEVSGKAQPLSYAEAQQAPSETAAGTASPAYSQPQAAAWGAKQKQGEEQRQAEVDTSGRRLFAAKAAPGAGVAHGAYQPIPQAATQTVTVAAAPLILQTASLPATPAVSAGMQSQLHGSISVNQIHLPSGLAVVSSTSTGSFVLAIDKAGTLFLSEDPGGTWERVKTQWTGRAVAVTERFEENGALKTAQAAQTGTGGNPSANGGASSPLLVIFELFNDKNQAWVSTDGRIWTSK